MRSSPDPPVTPFTIREATPDDAPAILACLREAFEPFRIDYTPEAFLDTVLSPETLKHRLGAMTVLVAVAEDTLIGTIGAAAEKNREGHLRGMAVRVAWQGSGVASRLLAAAEAQLLARDCHRITLDTTEPLTRAIAFYRRHGYTPTGRVQDFYGMPLYEYAKALAVSESRP